MLNNAKRKARYISGWLLVRPRRKLFLKLKKTCYLPPVSFDIFGLQLSNHYWIEACKAIFNFFCWLDNNAWCKFCTLDKRVLVKKPLIARVIQRIGATTAGFVMHGGECYHCGHPDGCQVEIAMDETGDNFRLTKSWTVGTMDGTDHRFRGITTCPRCGYQDEYEDGSL